MAKTSKLTGPALDWTVAKCMGYVHADGNVYLNCWEPSTNWAQGGPIIEREFITVGPYHDKAGRPTGVFQAYIGWGVEQLEPLFQCDGPTPLIAAMRGYVASKLGDNVKIPQELM